MAKVVYNRKITEDIFMMKVGGKYEGRQGQFYMLKPENTFLARPISIHDIEEDGIIFLYQVKGEGTRFFSSLREGYEIDLFGPRGNGFDIKKQKSYCLIGGGIGTAPLYLLARRLREENPDAFIKAYLGFTKEAYLTDKFEEVCDDVTVDIGGIITRVVNYEAFEKYYACGPDIMMKSAVEEGMKKGTDVTVSLESKMACGVGACLGCNVETPRGNIKVCKDGPVFEGRRVYFE